jgi:hypothetical protein
VTCTAAKSAAAARGGDANSAQEDSRRPQEMAVSREDEVYKNVRIVRIVINYNKKD